MDCQCQHESVCRYASEIRSQISQVISGDVDEEKIAWQAISEYIQKFCLRRLPFKTARTEGDFKTEVEDAKN